MLCDCLQAGGRFYAYLTLFDFVQTIAIDYY